MSSTLHVVSTRRTGGTTVATLSDGRALRVTSHRSRATGRRVEVRLRDELLVVRQGTSHPRATALAMEKLLAAITGKPRRRTSFHDSPLPLPLHRSTSVSDAPAPTVEPVPPQPAPQPAAAEPVSPPGAVWIFDTPDMGIVGAYDNEAAAKGTAEIIAEKPLTWHRMAGNVQVALDAPDEPVTSHAYFVRLLGMQSVASTADPLDDGSAARTEPPTEAQTVLAGQVYRVLAHHLHHGIGEADNCPACEASANPFASST